MDAIDPPVLPMSAAAKAVWGRNATPTSAQLTAARTLSGAKAEIAPFGLTTLYDDFQRADQLLNTSVAPTGQVWAVSGPAYATTRIKDGYVDSPDGNFYGFLDNSTAITQLNLSYTHLSPERPNVIMHLAGGTDLNNMLHLQIGAGSWILDKRIAGVWTNGIAQRVRQGTYGVGNRYSMSIKVSGTTVTVIDIDGTETSVTVSDIAGMGTLRYAGMQCYATARLHSISTGPLKFSQEPTFAKAANVADIVWLRGAGASRKKRLVLTTTSVGWYRVATPGLGDPVPNNLNVIAGFFRISANSAGTYWSIADFWCWCPHNSTAPDLSPITAGGNFGDFPVSQVRLSAQASAPWVVLDVYVNRVGTFQIDFDGVFEVADPATVLATLGAVALTNSKVITPFNALKKLQNINSGVATLVAGTVTVANTSITANSRIFVNRLTDAGTVGASYSVTRSAGVSFTVTAKDGTGASQAADTSIVAYEIIEP